MDAAYKQTILKILEAIDYSGDRNAFADTFVQTTFLQAIAELISMLPLEKQQQIQSELSTADTTEKFDHIFTQYFTQEQRLTALQKSAKEAIAAWLQEVSEGLQDEQRKKLNELLQSYAPSPTV